MVRPIVTHCKRGHEYTPENTLPDKRGKSCRICKNANHKIRYNADAKLRKRMQKAARQYYHIRKKLNDDARS